MGLARLGGQGGSKDPLLHGPLDAERPPSAGPADGGRSETTSWAARQVEQS